MESDLSMNHSITDAKIREFAEAFTQC